MSPPTRIACLGEAMVEITLDDACPDRAGLGFAGDVFNTAIYLKRAAPRHHVAFATKIGRDPLSQRLRAMAAAEGLATDLMVECDRRLPGLYAISTDQAGERSFLYWRDRSAAREMLQPSGLDLDALAYHDLVYLSAITLAILPARDRSRLLAWMAAYRRAGGRIAFDSNHRPALWPDLETARQTVAAAWALTDLALPSLEDECALFGDKDEAAVLARLAGFGLRQGALKRGARGPLGLDGSAPPALPGPERVVDTTAAGDSFNAAWLAAWLEGRDATACLAAGHALACQVIAAPGAILPRAPGPTPEETPR